MAALLAAGSWLVGVRALAGLIQHLPRLRWALRAAESAGEPKLLLWVGLGATLAACAAAGLMLLLSLLVLLLVEGSHVLIDELGIAVEHSGMPGPLSRKLGSGRLPWKRVSAIERQGFFFVVRGGGERTESGSITDPDLRFVMVEELERLVLTVIERSPNLKFKE